MSPLLLFLYGTLLPEHAPPEVASVVRQLRSLAPGRVRGYLYDLGAYPGAILDPSADAVVHGRVCALPDDAGVLSAMDAYEGFDPANPAASLFSRARARVELEDGREVDCWMYVYNRDPRGVRRITGGEWRSR